MKVEQIYTGCLAQGAYFIESAGEAAIIDPLRETAPYLEKAKKHKADIKYIFETHFHADFVSGHVSLAEVTGASIVYGPNAHTKFPAIIASDGQTFQIGNVTITALHTPGHTLESTTYLLRDEEANEVAIFTGDTLFLGDVGRPDLAQKGNEITEKELAGMLYDSLRSKILPLPDDITVYPAHGAGSACGKNMMKETVDTLGNQKRMNYALRADMTKEEFIEEVTEGLLPPPAYFPLNVKLNKEGYENLDQVVARGENALTPEAVEQLANQDGALILDIRKPADFAKAHIPNSIFIGLDGGFAPWVGELIVDVKQPLILVVTEGREEEAITRLSRVGFDQTLGYLKGGIDAWQKQGKEVDAVASITPQEFASRYDRVRDQVYDVRKESEYLSEHVNGAKNTPLGSLNDHLGTYGHAKEAYVHCAGGYRSMIAASILKSRGIHNLVNVEQGFKGIKETDIRTSDYVCPSEL